MEAQRTIFSEAGSFEHPAQAMAPIIVKIYAIFLFISSILLIRIIVISVSANLILLYGLAERLGNQFGYVYDRRNIIATHRQDINK